MKAMTASFQVTAVGKVEPDLRAGFGAHDGGCIPIQPARPAGHSLGGGWRAGSTTLIHYPVLALGFALLTTGCGNRAQQQAYERAVQAETHLTAENAPALVADYRRVIALEPNTAWARKAGERINAVEARVKAEELHKSVFQEHGVD